MLSFRTLDCMPSLADRNERMLVEAAAAVIVRFGVHRQAAAIIAAPFAGEIG
ncbi:MAG: hypothetical protein IT521_16160 [Burkholderiales bacterium]|nr:hypothetical protein [Burkholderiales bacterium]